MTQNSKTLDAYRQISFDIRCRLGINIKAQNKYNILIIILIVGENQENLEVLSVPTKKKVVKNKLY